MFFFFAQSLRQPEDTHCKDDLEQNANTSFFPPCGCISFHFKDTQSAALWELTYLMGRSLRISFLHPTTVMFLMLLALIISSISPIVKPDTILSSTQMNPSEVRHQKGSFGEAFAKLRYKLKDEVKVTKWEAALEKVANLSGLELGDRNESEFIQDIIKWVDSIMVNRTFLKVAKHPVGIESPVRDIFQHLNMGRNDIICMIGIFGTGGIGKTTISKEVYNRISYQFEGSCFLKNIRETSKVGGLIQLQKTLLYETLGISLECHDTEKGINVIRHRLCFKRVLLILDDVDDLVQLETLAGARD
ncbi:hypothetical protein F2P56_013563, partial [Juglans regia]